MPTYVSVFALVLAYVALVAGYASLRTLAKLRRATFVLGRGARGTQGRETLLEATARHAEATAVLAEEVQQLRAELDRTRAELLASTEKTSVDALTLSALTRSDVLGVLEQTRTEVLTTVEKALAERDVAVSGVLRNVALVRYDAFSDMSGHLSFSLALLDEHGDGVAVSAIAGRTDTRVYAKGVSAGKGEHELSPEEQQAVEAALHKQRSGILSRKAG